MSAQLIEGEFYFDPADPVFKVHFPLFPVVPGSLIIGEFLDVIPFTCVKIKQFKFIHFAIPGKSAYQISITDNVARCQLIQENQIIAKGTIIHET